MTARWPEFCPLGVLRQGFEIQDEENVSRFTPESGPDITQPRPGPETTLYPVILPRYTYDQRETMRRFWRHRLGSGALPFTRRDPAIGDEALFTFAAPIRWTPHGPTKWDGATMLRRMP